MIASIRACSSIESEAIGQIAAACLRAEVATYPKPGLVSHVDSGAHRDMDAALLERSADTLAPFFSRLAEAGAAGASMVPLRAIGIEAEHAMMRATHGVNTHRGAIFGLGLLCAATGLRRTYGMSRTLGSIVRGRWGEQIFQGPVLLHSHGATAARHYGSSGARGEAAAGFPSVYQVGLPAYRAGLALAPDDDEAARVHACMALIASVEDTNLLHRGGADGLAFAQREARRFMDEGGVGARHWRTSAINAHRQFVVRNLSPGGCADLLAMTLFVARSEQR